ncbi:MAG: acyl-CoA thioesterase [Elusimicrobiota bacterium]|jgi:acyl-CoA thioester hydrolase|nr:acyl-CoA thioesterase [Elusimicrobiota bacterium]
MKEIYFKQNPNDPNPLRAFTKRKVRFDEIDPLNIMWHGHYASFFEEGRLSLGAKYSIGYMDFYKAGVIIPLKKFHIDYILPLEFDKVYEIETILHWNEAARLDFSYNIFSNDKLTTTGYSVHLMLDKNKNILVSKPAFFEDFCLKWKEGVICEKY